MRWSGPKLPKEAHITMVAVVDRPATRPADHHGRDLFDVAVEQFNRAADVVGLEDSMRRILSLPPQTRVFVCHDYPPNGRHPQWETTVADQRARNIHVRDGVTEDEFVGMRQARDATLDMPALILPSLQVNVRAGQLPPPEDNGVSYLKIPLNLLGKATVA